MKHFSSLLLLISLLLAVQPVSAQKTEVESLLKKGGMFRIKSRVSNSTADEYITVREDKSVYVGTLSQAENDFSQIWIIEKSGTTYTLRSASTGWYIPVNIGSVKNKVVAEPGIFYMKYSAGNDSDESTSYVTISANENYSSTSCLNHDSNDNVVRRAANNASNGIPASDWVLEKVTDYTKAQVRTALNAGLGYVNAFSPDKYYRIRNTAYGKLLTELPGAGKVTCTELEENNFGQIWKINATGNSTKLQSAVSDKYIQKQNGARSTQYVTGAAEASFTRALLSAPWEYIFTIADANGIGLHSADTRNYVVVGWDISSDASRWTFEEVTVDEEALAVAREEARKASELFENASTYNQLLPKYFADKACTELNATYQNMDVAQLEAEIVADGFSEVICDMILKVRNNSWSTYGDWRKTERDFRVAEYTAYSDLWRWTDILGQGYQLARLTNPTGISVNKGDIVTLYVGNIPSGHTLALEAAVEGAGTGTQTTLQTGFNAIVAEETSTLFIYHSVDNTRGGGKPYTPIANYPAIPVHIEGGFVNGYIDITKGDTNEDWAQMRQHLLKGSVVDFKTPHLTFHLNREKAVSTAGDQLTEILGIWENMMVKQRSLQGLEEFEGYFNNPLSVTAPGSNYMHAGGYGTYYATSTLASIFNYDSMNRYAGSLWGPAHEMGHIHQQLIKMIGTTEISNNVYSNIAVYDQGRSTSRCKSIQDTFSDFHAGKAWLDRIYDLWQCTHLYWQLYQYFHLQGFMPDFYPQLYKALRNNKLDQRQGTFVSATNDYLKFYETCCSVSGYDLTEFFAAYGFFMIPTLESTTLDKVTKQAHHVDDYGDYYVTVTQSEINQSLQRVKRKGYKPCNIIFIEDRISAPIATYEGANGRTKKESYATGDASIGEIGKCGKVGQYTDFVQEDAITGTYIYKVRSTSTYDNITVSGGKGAVGFKVYDADGNLRVLSNEFTFRLPNDLRGTKFQVYAAEGNGKDVRIYAEGEVHPYDINKDSTVDVGDVTMLVSLVLGGGATSPDLNGDGKVDVGDVTELVAYVLGGN